MEKYLPLTDGQELQVKVSYYRDSRVRGYYLSVMPVKRTEYSISFAIFSGVPSKLVKQVARKSAKAEREAIEAAALMEGEMIAEVLEKEKLTLKEGAAQ